MATHAATPASFRSPNKTATIRAMRNASTGLSSTPTAIIDHCAQLEKLLMAPNAPRCGSSGHTTPGMIAKRLTGSGDEDSGSDFDRRGVRIGSAVPRGLGWCARQEGARRGEEP